MMWKRFFFSLISILFFLFGLILWYVYSLFSVFAVSANTTPTAIYKQFTQAGLHKPVAEQGRKNIIIVGLDGVDGRDESSVLTDTMMIASLNIYTGNIDLISLPRDLWIAEYQTKINALYYYGKDKNPQHPEYFPKEVLEHILAIPIHHVFVMNLESLGKVIDTIGGIDVTVEREFIDDMFPRSGVDVSKETDPKKLYETVSFKSGLEHMSGERALTFIRSRHSKNDNEGTDDARSKRQQQVIVSIINQIKKLLESAEMQKLGTLYAVYNLEFSRSLPMEELISIGLVMKEKILSMNIVLHNFLSELFVPPVSKHRQWVYEPNDPSWKEIQTVVKDMLQ